MIQLPTSIQLQYTCEIIRLLKSLDCEVKCGWTINGKNVLALTLKQYQKIIAVL